MLACCCEGRGGRRWSTGWALPQACLTMRWPLKRSHARFAAGAGLLWLAMRTLGTLLCIACARATGWGLPRDAPAPSCLPRGRRPLMVDAPAWAPPHPPHSHTISGSCPTPHHTTPPCPARAQIKNRESAARSRAKRQEYTATLEQQVRARPTDTPGCCWAVQGQWRDERAHNPRLLESVLLCAPSGRRPGCCLRAAMPRRGLHPISLPAPGLLSARLRRHPIAAPPALSHSLPRFFVPCNPAPA